MNRYRNFDLELFEYRLAQGGESTRCRVRASPAGEQRIADAESIAFPADLRTSLVLLEVRQLPLERLIEVGEQMAEILMPPKVRRLYRRSQAALAEDEGLRIRLRLDSLELADVPWEYSYVARPDTPPDQKGPEGFLCLDARVSMVRFEVSEEQPIELKAIADGDLRLVALLSNPAIEELGALDLRQEELDLRRSFEGLPNLRARFLHGGTIDELEEGLEEETHVFHFSGHGVFERRADEESGEIEGSGALVLVGPTGGPELFPAATLAGNLRAAGVRLAVLGACEAGRRDQVNPWSGVAPALTRGGIPAVVGNQYDIDDASAVAFSQRFYRTLVNGQPIDAAVTNGRLAIFNRGGAAERDWGVPVLYLRADQSVLFPPHPGPVRANAGLLFAALALLTLWFALHVYPLAAAKVGDLTRGAGLTVTALAFLWMVLKLLKPLFQSAAGDRKRPLTERWLKKKWAGTAGLWLLTVAVFLNLTTTSIYLTHDGTEEVGVVKVRVDRDAEGSPFLPLPELRAERGKSSGGPLLLMGTWARVHLGVESPVGYKLKTMEVALRPWKSLHLTFPTDLEKRQVFRLIPEYAILRTLPGLEEESSDYELRLTIGGKELVDRKDLRRGILYFGAEEERLKKVVTAETAEARLASLNECAPSAALRATWLSGLENDVWWTSPELLDLGGFEVQIVRVDTGEEVSQLQAHEPPAEPAETGPAQPITSICLGSLPR